MERIYKKERNAYSNIFGQMVYESKDPTLPKPGDTVEHSTEQHFRVLDQIYQGPFSAVYRVENIAQPGAQFAMKVERIKSIERYLVMELVGMDLGRLRRARQERRFTMATALRVLIQTLERIESLHEAGYISRDVKAPNFAIGVDNQAAVVYMLDYGFARKYVDEKGQVIPPRPSAALMGTFQYCSLASHTHKDQSRKDDLESWLYMAIELIRGPLPWAKIDGNKEHKKILEYKLQIRQGEPRQKFFESIPYQFEEIMDKIDGYRYYDKPDYNSIRGLIRQAATDYGITLEEPLDWERDSRMTKKAMYVGELGESNMASSRLENQELKPLPAASKMLEIELEEKTPEEEAVRKNKKLQQKNLKIKNKRRKFQETNNVWTALPISSPRSSAESAETPATDSPNKTRAKSIVSNDCLLAQQ
ncbi:hypothetical protein WR25_20570 [Diploscapter pachys]|uniref:Protein kinase domain-containing protein n=1 Tax=Diploscapter pachys TaxID=2018661 RepID=A0A2A2JSV5_9BILA|nr:hypothetical protein WR25_20570 [Diploscapter pachys]